MLNSCFLHDSDRRERIELLQEFFGAALSGHATRYQKAVILAGEGANGKSTVQTIIAELFPPDARTSVNPQDMENEYRRALLVKSRLNVVSELPEADILASEAVKAIIDGSQIGAREIREAPVHFRPRAAHLFSCNRLPGVRDDSLGFWRRWIVLPFNRIFESHEQDRTLADRIIRNELPEIASWALDGAARLAERGDYSLPDSVTAALDEWKQDSDQVACFVASALRILPKNAPVTQWMTGAGVYALYQQWAKDNGHGQLSNARIGKRLAALSVPRVRKEQGIFWAVNAKIQVAENGPNSGGEEKRGIFD